MTKHQFGGDWTEEKLERIRKYLCAYTTIFTRNPNARYYTTVYVDAFAGCGYRIERGAQLDPTDLLETTIDDDAEQLKKGSARIALEVEPGFDRHVFIESEADRAADLRQLKSEFPGKADSVQIEQSDANAFLQDWCRQTNWQKARAVVFLDPYGMQVEWATLEAIAETKAIDLWLLFPIGVAVNRLLTKSGPPPDPWAKALTRIFGTDEWKEAFYQTHEEPTLFGIDSVERKVATLDSIGSFFCARLKRIFSKVATNPLTLRNSRQTPIYLLCFAAGNSKGATTAVKIAQDILK